MDSTKNMKIIKYTNYLDYLDCNLLEKILKLNMKSFKYDENKDLESNIYKYYFSYFITKEKYFNSGSCIHIGIDNDYRSFYKNTIFIDGDDWVNTAESLKVDLFNKYRGIEDNIRFNYLEEKYKTINKKERKFLNWYKLIYDLERHYDANYYHIRLDTKQDFNIKYIYNQSYVHKIFHNKLSPSGFKSLKKQN